MSEGTMGPAAETADVVDNMTQSKTAGEPGVNATADPDAAPGLSTRGWSPEVTARHPKLVAATMKELASSGALALSSDPVQLKNQLRNAAIRLNYQRLSEGLTAAAAASPEAQAALAQVMEELDAAAAAAAPAPEPAATTTRSTRTSSTTTSEPATS